MQVAIFDTNTGHLQWLGHAEGEGHEAAIRSFDKQVGAWEASADRADVLAQKDEDSLLVMDVTDDQAAELERWSAGGFPSSLYPDGLPSGVRYTSGEVLEILNTKN